LSERDLDSFSVWEILNHPSNEVQSLERKVTILTHLVFELLREVEALREAQIKQTQAQGVEPKESSQVQAYLETALLSHNAAGVTTGLQKILLRWLGDDAESIPKTRVGSVLREVLMLKRLGLTEEDIEKYVEDVEIAEKLT
jgi:hypothetical protein